MAIYHLSIKTFRRSRGQSATAAAAYRSGEKIVDKRTGEVHDYSRKGGVVSSEIVLPEKAPAWAHNRSELWNQAEQAETRKNSVVAREFEVALPSELTQEQRREVAVRFARELVKKHGFAAEVSIHKPGKEGDNRNHHAHILVTTRRLTERGFTEKTRELDERLDRGPKEIEQWREKFAQLQNRALEKHQHKSRVDHRTLQAQGIDREPTQHRGPAATAIERRTQEPSRIRRERSYEIEAAQEPTPSPAAPVPDRAAALATLRAEGARLRQEQTQQKAQEQARYQAEAQRQSTLRAMREEGARLRQQRTQKTQEPALEKAAPLSKDHEPSRNIPPEPKEKQANAPKPPEPKPQEHERVRGRDWGDRER